MIACRRPCRLAPRQGPRSPEHDVARRGARAGRVARARSRAGRPGAAVPAARRNAARDRQARRPGSSGRQGPARFRRAAPRAPGAAVGRGAAGGARRGRGRHRAARGSADAGRRPRSPGRAGRPHRRARHAARDRASACPPSSCCRGGSANAPSRRGCAPAARWRPRSAASAAPSWAPSSTPSRSRATRPPRLCHRRRASGAGPAAHPEVSRMIPASVSASVARATTGAMLAVLVLASGRRPSIGRAIASVLADGGAGVRRDAAGRVDAGAAGRGHRRRRPRHRAPVAGLRAANALEMAIGASMLAEIGGMSGDGRAPRPRPPPPRPPRRSSWPSSMRSCASTRRRR